MTQIGWLYNEEMNTWAPGEIAARGGSVAGAARVLGPFPFAFDTPNIEDGVTIWTPAVGDILLDAWISVLTAFDGSTPMGDIGTFTEGQAFGMLASNNAAADLSSADVSSGGLDRAILSQGGGDVNGVYQVTLAEITYSSYRQLPGKFVAAAPVKVVVSQDGEIGGDSVGGSAGAGAVYLIVATPSLT